MAKKKAQAQNKSTEKQSAQLPVGEQMSDILLIMDKMELIVRALSEIDKNGKAKTVPIEKKEENNFLKLDKHSNLAENFIKNFWSQLKDPTRFRLIKLPFSNYQKNKETIKDLSEGKDTDRVKEFLKKYEIRLKEAEQTDSINNKNKTIMAKKEQSPQTPAAENQPATGVKYRFNESLIDWKQLENFGLSKDFLQEKGLLDPMLRGYKTNQTVPISMNFGSAVLRTDARLSFQQSATGSAVLAIHGIRKEPELERAFFGHIFSPEDKQNLKDSGNMGRVVDLKTRNGETTPSLISLDKLTNELAAVRVEHIYISDTIKGVKLTKDEMTDLKAGKSIYLEGMISQNNKEFNGNVQYNADRRGIEFIFENDRLFNSRKK
jgi:hypothetical protein